MIKTAIIMLALAVPMCAAYATTDTMQISSIYSVHLAHTGDMIVVENNDKIAHTIRGQDNAGEAISSGTINPGQNFTMTFMFPGQFSFYDELNRGNFGEIYLFDPGTPFPMDVYNHTSANDMYQLPQYTNSAILAPPVAPTNSSAPIEQVNHNTETNNSVPPMTSNMTFNESNSTNMVPSNSTDTQQLQQQVQTLEATNAQLTSKVNTLQTELARILSIINGQ